jgi:hypothetical protein
MSVDEVLSIAETPLGRRRSGSFKADCETFTFTFICHHGKTHNLRSRGDTPRRAQIVL